MSIRLLAVLTAVLLLGPLACRQRGTQRSVSDSTFVRTMVQLRHVATDSLMDSTMRDSARRATLRQNGLTADQLEQAAASLAGDPDRAVRVWRAIEAGVSGRPLIRPAIAPPSPRRTG